MALVLSELVLFSFPTSYLFNIALAIPLVSIIEKVHLDDLNVYLDTLDTREAKEATHIRRLDPNLN